MNRIMQATTTGSIYGSNYSMDLWGNLYAVSSVNGNTPCFDNCFTTTADGANHLVGFDYDASGNQTTDALSNHFVYDSENRIIKIGSTRQYWYDGDGVRIAKPDKYYWYGPDGQLWAESDTSGTIQSEYIYVGGRRIARKDSIGDLYYFYQDHLGTSRMIMKAGDSTPCYDADFAPYGTEKVYANTCSDEHKFTGKERDIETGLDYFGARYYGSNMGRFMSPDAVQLTTRHLVNPQKWNRYAYVHNNPLSFVDPDGLDDWYIFRPLISKNAAGTGNWTAATKAAEARGDTIHMLKGSDANVGAYNKALTTPGAHVVALTHADSKNGGAIQLYDGISSGSRGSESRTTTQSADPSKGITENITATNSFTVTAKEVAVFGCDSQGLAPQYSDTTFVGVTPGPNGDGGISFWLGGNAAAAFVGANGGQPGVDAANAQVPNSPDPRDKGAETKLNPPEPKKEQEN